MCASMPFIGPFQILGERWNADKGEHVDPRVQTMRFLKQNYAVPKVS